MMDYFKIGGLFLMLVIVCVTAIYVAHSFKSKKSETLFPSQKHKYAHLMTLMGYDHYDIKEFLKEIKSYEELKEINEKLEKALTDKNLV